jgi:hypothetical protein
LNMIFPRKEGSGLFLSLRSISLILTGIESTSCAIACVETANNKNKLTYRPLIVTKKRKMFLPDSKNNIKILVLKGLSVSKSRL